MHCEQREQHTDLIETIPRFCICGLEFVIAILQRANLLQQVCSTHETIYSVVWQPHIAYGGIVNLYLTGYFQRLLLCELSVSIFEWLTNSVIDTSDGDRNSVSNSKVTSKYSCNGKLNVKLKHLYSCNNTYKVMRKYLLK